MLVTGFENFVIPVSVYLKKCFSNNYENPVDRTSFWYMNKVEQREICVKHGETAWNIRGAAN